MASYRAQHREFIRREKVYENKYKKQFYAYLNSVNNSAATAYANGSMAYDLQHAKLTAIYTKLYNDVTINEAEIQWNQFDDPKPKQQKDLIDVFASVFTPNTNDVPINLWRSLLGDCWDYFCKNTVIEYSHTSSKYFVAVKVICSIIYSVKFVFWSFKVNAFTAS